MRIYLDKDGVIVNFIKGAAELFNVDYDELIDRWDPGVWEMEKVLGIPSKDFYNKIKNSGWEFWADLPEYDYADELISFCRNLAPTYFLTKPTQDANCVKGKLLWLYDKFGNGFSDYIFTPKKDNCARPDHVLIDDSEKNVNAFRERGGHAILFPSICNSRHYDRHNALVKVKSDLLKIRDIILSSKNNS